MNRGGGLPCHKGAMTTVCLEYSAKKDGVIGIEGNSVCFWCDGVSLWLFSGGQCCRYDVGLQEQDCLVPHNNARNSKQALNEGYDLPTAKQLSSMISFLNMHKKCPLGVITIIILIIR